MGLSGASFHVSYLRFLVSNNLLLFTRPLCKHLLFFFFSLTFFPNISQKNVYSTTDKSANGISFLVSH